METLKTIAKRKSTRNFSADTPLSNEDLQTILKAGCAAPVGGADYQSLHLSAITDAETLDLLEKSVQQAFHTDQRFLYNAPALVLISASAQQKFPNIQYANTGCIIENMLLAATDLGIDSVYIWGLVAGIAGNREVCAKIGIPDGFTPVSAAAFGYAAEVNLAEKELSISLSVNYI